MYIYVYDQYEGNRGETPNTETLISIACRQYLKDAELNLDAAVLLSALKRSEKGKPYFDGFPIYCSVSHSGKLWVCLFSSQQVGVDIQKNQQKNHLAIARRFFQPEEQKAVETGGLSAFIALWCRKEAFIKYQGSTIGETIDWLNVAEDGSAASRIDYQGRVLHFSTIAVNPDYTCVAAHEAKEEIWIKKLKTK